MRGHDDDVDDMEDTCKQFELCVASQNTNERILLIALRNYEFRGASIKRGDQLETALCFVKGAGWLAKHDATGRLGLIPRSHVVEVKAFFHFEQKIALNPGENRFLVANCDFLPDQPRWRELCFRRGQLFETTLALRQKYRWLVRSISTGEIGYVPGIFMTEAPWFPENEHFSGEEKVFISLVDHKQTTIDNNRRAFSLKKGEHLEKIINRTHADGNESWIARSKTTKQIWYVSSKHVAEFKASWYAGAISKNEAVRRLMASGNRSGAFLIRDNDQDGTKVSCYCLSVRHLDQVKHYEIGQVYCSAFVGFYINKEIAFSSVHGLVAYYSKESDTLGTKLKEPCVYGQGADALECEPKTERRLSQIFQDLTENEDVLAYVTAGLSYMEQEAKYWHKNNVSVFQCTTRSGNISPIYTVSDDTNGPGTASCDRTIVTSSDKLKGIASEGERNEKVTGLLTEFTARPTLGTGCAQPSSRMAVVRRVIEKGVQYLTKVCTGRR